MDLLNNLTQSLGVNEEQAKGGAGLIFNMAKEKLGAEDFSKVSDTVPGMDEMLKAAPESSEIGGAVGGLASTLGGGAGKLGELYDGFSKLGLDPSMVGRFTPTILSYRAVYIDWHMLYQYDTSVQKR